MRGTLQVDDMTARRRFLETDAVVARTARAGGDAPLRIARACCGCPCPPARYGAEVPSGGRTWHAALVGVDLAVVQLDAPRRAGRLDDAAVVDLNMEWTTRCVW